MFRWQQKPVTEYRPTIRSSVDSRIDIELELQDIDNSGNLTFKQDLKEGVNKYQVTRGREKATETKLPPMINKNLVEKYISDRSSKSTKEDHNNSSDHKNETEIMLDSKQYEGERQTLSSHESSQNQPLRNSQSPVPRYQNGNQVINSNKSLQIQKYKKLPSRQNGGADDRSSIYNGDNLKSDSEKGSVYSCYDNLSNAKPQDEQQENKVYTLDDFKGAKLQNLNQEWEPQNKLNSDSNKNSEISLSKNLTASPTSRCNIRVASPFLLSQKDSQEIKDQDVDTYSNCIVKEQEQKLQHKEQQQDYLDDLQAEQQESFNESSEYYQALSQQDIQSLAGNNLKHAKSKSYSNLNEQSFEKELDANLSFLDNVVQENDLDLDQKNLSENKMFLDNIISKLEGQVYPDPEVELDPYNNNSFNSINSDRSMSRKLSDGVLEYKPKNNSREFKAIAMHKLIQVRQGMTDKIQQEQQLENREVQLDQHINGQAASKLSEQTPRLFETRLQLDDSLKGSDAVEKLLGNSDKDSLKVDSFWDESLNSRSRNMGKGSLKGSQLKEALKLNLQIPSISDDHNQNISFAGWNSTKQNGLPKQNIELGGIAETDEGKSSPQSSRTPTESTNRDPQVRSIDTVDLRYFKQGPVIGQSGSSNQGKQSNAVLTEDIQDELDVYNQDIVTLNDSKQYLADQNQSSLQYEKQSSEGSNIQSHHTNSRSISNQEAETSKEFSGISDFQASPKSSKLQSQGQSPTAQQHNLLNSDKFSLSSQVLGQVPQIQHGMNFQGNGLQPQMGMSQQMFQPQPIQIMTPQGMQYCYIVNPYQQQPMMGYNQMPQPQFNNPYFQQQQMFMNQQQPQFMMPFNPYMQQQFQPQQVQQGFCPQQNFQINNSFDYRGMNMGQQPNMMNSNLQQQQQLATYNDPFFGQMNQQQGIKTSQSGGTSVNVSQDQQETIFQSPRSQLTQITQSNTVNTDFQDNLLGPSKQAQSESISQTDLQKAIAKVREVYSPRSSCSRRSESKNVSAVEVEVEAESLSANRSSSKNENRSQIASQYKGLQEVEEIQPQYKDTQVKDGVVSNYGQRNGRSSKSRQRKNQDSSKENARCSLDGSINSEKSHLDLDSPTDYLATTQSYQDLLNSQYLIDQSQLVPLDTPKQNSSNKRSEKPKQDIDTLNVIQNQFDDEFLKSISLSKNVETKGKAKDSLGKVSAGSQDSNNKKLGLPNIPQPPSSDPCSKANSSAYQLSYLHGDSGSFNKSIYELSKSTTQLQQLTDKTPSNTSNRSRSPFGRRNKGVPKNRSRNLLCGCVTSSCVDRTGRQIKGEENMQRLLDTDENKSPRQSPGQSPTPGQNSKLASISQLVREQTPNGISGPENTDISQQPLLQDNPLNSTKSHKKNSIFRKKSQLTIDVDSHSNHEALYSARSDQNNLLNNGLESKQEECCEDLILLEDNGIFALKPNGPLPQKLYQEQGQPISPRATSPLAVNVHNQQIKVAPLQNVDSNTQFDMQRNQNGDYSSYAYQINNLKMDNLQSDLLNSQSSKIKHYPGDSQYENTNFTEQSSQVTNSFFTVKSNQVC